MQSVAWEYRYSVQEKDGHIRLQLVEYLHRSSVEQELTFSGPGRNELPTLIVLD